MTAVRFVVSGHNRMKFLISKRTFAAERDLKFNKQCLFKIGIRWQSTVYNTTLQTKLDFFDIVKEIVLLKVLISQMSALFAERDLPSTYSQVLCSQSFHTRAFDLSDPASPSKCTGKKYINFEFSFYNQKSYTANTNLLPPDLSVSFIHKRATQASSNVYKQSKPCESRLSHR